MGVTHSIEDDELMISKIRSRPSASKVAKHANIMSGLLYRSTKRLENAQDASQDVALDRALVFHTRLIQELLEAKFYITGDYTMGDRPLARRVLKKHQLLSSDKFDSADVIFSGAKCLLAFDHDFDLDPECRTLSASERSTLLKLVVQSSKSFY